MVSSPSVVSFSRPVDHTFRTSTIAPPSSAAPVAPGRRNDVVAARSIAEVAEAVFSARRVGRPIAVVGRGHPEARSAARRGAILLELRSLCTVSAIDPLGGWIEVTAGLECRAVQAVLDGLRCEGRVPFPDSRMLVGAAVGGVGHDVAVCEELAEHIISLTVVDGLGQIHEVSAESDPHWFRLLVGGAGWFGVIVAVRVSLPPRRRGVVRVAPADADHAPRALADALESGARCAAWHPTLPFFGPEAVVAEFEYGSVWGLDRPEPKGRPWTILLEAADLRAEPPTWAAEEALKGWRPRRCVVRVRLPRAEIRVFLRDVVRRAEETSVPTPFIRLRTPASVVETGRGSGVRDEVLIEVESAAETTPSDVAWAMGVELVQSAVALGGYPEVGSATFVSPLERRFVVPALEDRLALKTAFDTEDRFHNDHYLALRDASR